MHLFDLKSKLPEFMPSKDEFIALADSLLESEIKLRSGIVRFPYDEFIKLSKPVAGYILHRENNLQIEAFEEEFNTINNELLKVSSELRTVYNQNLKSILGGAMNEVSAKDILYLVESFRIKAKRLLYVAAPDYSFSTGFSKKSNKKYETIKAFWINDAGEKVRSFSKNVGISGNDIEQSVSKLYESLGYILLDLDMPTKNKLMIDLIVLKDKKKWVVEIKMKDKKIFMDFYARLELWKLYQSIYGV